MKSIAFSALLCITAYADNPGYCIPSAMHPHLGINLSSANSIAIEENGSALVADLRNNRIFRLSANGTVSVIAGTGSRGYAGDGGPANAAALADPESVFVTQTGEIFIADTGNGRIRKIDRSGLITTVAGGGGPFFDGPQPEQRNPLEVPLLRPRQVQLDRNGNVYFLADHLSGTYIFIVDAQTHLLRLFEPTLPKGVKPFQFYPSAFTIDEHDRVVAAGMYEDVPYNASRTVRELKYMGAGSERKTFAGLISRVSAMAYDAAGNLYLSESGRVRKVSVSDELYTIAGGASGPYIPPEKLAELGSATVSVTARGSNVYLGSADGIRRIDAAACSAPFRPILGQSSQSIGNAGYSSSAASRSQARIAPGQLITIYGAGLAAEPGISNGIENGIVPTEGGGARVMANGKPLPILFAGPGQVNTILPFETRLPVCLSVEFRGVSSDAHCFSVLSPTDPGVFTYAGTDHILALNQDNSLHSSSNPAAAGSAVQFWGTGFGSMSPPPVDGVITTNVLSRIDADVAVTVDGTPATVLYAGSAPGIVAGVVQLNVRVPEGSRALPLGSRVVIKAGNTETQGLLWIRER